MRTLVLGLLVALNAMPVCAQTKVPVVKPPVPTGAAATRPAGPIDLSFHPGTTTAPLLDPVDLALESASAEVRSVARWVIDSRDNVGLPFLLIDKVNARVFAFTPAGQLQAATPALLGMARGDRLLAPNSATMEQMPPSVRITPAGRFVSRLAVDSLGKELLVLDYDASISLHAVIKGTPKERRAERLKSPTSEDNRISYGCINVPVPFYETVVSPAFAKTKGIVYVLPETGPASALFGMHPVGAAVTRSPAFTTPAAPAVPAPDAR